MPAIVVALLVAISAAVYSVREPSTISDADTFRVVTFNIYKGMNSDDRYDLQGTIEAIARLDADVVGVQETVRNHPQFNCDDQPALIAEGLRRLTGQAWSYTYAKAWVTANRECTGRGRGDDVATEGLAFFTPDRILAADTIRLPGSRIGLVARVASMPDVPVIVTHLTAYRRNQALRMRQIEILLAWTAQQRPGILLGDFNAWTGTMELSSLTARYRDAWADARLRGLSAGVASGSTRPGSESRIDFVFYAPHSPLSVARVEVADTSDENLVEASDHRPVAATFRRLHVRR